MSSFNVIPAQAGIQHLQQMPDPGFRRGDELHLHFLHHTYAPLHRANQPAEAATDAFFDINGGLSLGVCLYRLVPAVSACNETIAASDTKRLFYLCLDLFGIIQFVVRRDVRQ
jgi:hypothetical protein